MVRDRKLMIQALKTFEVEKQSPKELTKMMIDIIDTLAQADDIISKKVAPPIKQLEWISVKERIPSQEELDLSMNWEFLCCCAVPTPTGGDYIQEIRVIQYDIFDKRWCCENVIVTHWMNIQALPKISL